jgi:hypothetical protein
LVVASAGTRENIVRSVFSWNQRLVACWATQVKLASQLTPAFLRVGGTQGDAVYYDVSGAFNGSTPPGYTHVLNQSLWHTVNTFAANAGFEVVFGINAGAGPRGNTGFAPWNASNALSLMKYSAAQGYPIAGYEFGNEPDLFLTAMNISGRFGVWRWCAAPLLNRVYVTCLQ